MHDGRYAYAWIHPFEHTAVALAAVLLWNSQQLAKWCNIYSVYFDFIVCSLLKWQI